MKKEMLSFDLKNPLLSTFVVKTTLINFGKISPPSIYFCCSLIYGPILAPACRLRKFQPPVWPRKPPHPAPP